MDSVTHTLHKVLLFQISKFNMFFYRYTKAKESLNVESKSSYHQWGSQQDKTLWIALIDHLKKNDLLPVVAFTFSRQKCDNNAANLLSLDLLSNTEKDHVKYFFNKCIRCLKEEDRNIPQVIKMRDILCRGIGVHHSGILPIIKEIVELLFQQGYIKVRYIVLENFFSYYPY